MGESPTVESQSYFLSYSRSDQEFALRLAADIRARGISLWIDQLDIRPSEHWDRAIEQAVRDSRGIVVVLSPRSVASDNVADEVSFAIDSGKSVLPVMIERCKLPLRITRMQVIDATGTYEDALERCVAELRRSAEPASSQDLAAQQETNAISRADVDFHRADPHAVHRSNCPSASEARKQSVEDRRGAGAKTCHVHSDGERTDRVPPQAIEVTPLHSGRNLLTEAAFDPFLPLGGSVTVP